MQYARSSRNLGKPNVKGATPPIASVNALKVIEIEKGIDRAVCFTVPKVHQDFGLKEIGAKVEEKIDAQNFRPRHDVNCLSKPSKFARNPQVFIEIYPKFNHFLYRLKFYFEN